MKGHEKVIEQLNHALFLELGAVNQYWIHYRLTEDWGYTKLANKEREESIEEMGHVDRSEERRVGKECRSRWVRDHYKKITINSSI